MKRKRRKSRRSQPNDEGHYICDACGEEIVVPLDPSAGESQEYVEDCPVCCRPNVIHVEFDEDGGTRVWAEAE
ncbi:MAG: CPXCG motif-containing cysteine-rich protein [Planctomycetaceae bacterium]|nr:CPXCG motif-containing cysteine-rich protein [Planctomycetaceae bacterium]